MGKDRTPNSFNTSHFKIYFYNRTLYITTILCKNEISFSFLVHYVDNLLPYFYI
jgi:hypothetical protein